MAEIGSPSSFCLAGDGKQALAVLRDPDVPFATFRWTLPSLTAPLVWSAAVTAARAEARGVVTDGLKLVIDGRRVRDQDMWPGAEPTDIVPDAWTTRVLGATPPQERGLLFFARGLQEHDRGFLEVLLHELGPILMTLGLTAGPVESEMFYGSYAATPGGIHREGCANMHIVVSGEKVMHSWVGTDWIPAGRETRDTSEPTMGTAEEYLLATDLDDVRALGTSVPATGGEGIYWRSGVWHIAEAPTCSMALNIPAYTGTFAPDPERIAVPVDGTGRIRSGWLDEYRRFTGSAADAVALLARVSAVGMLCAPAAHRDRTVGPLRRRSNAPLIWVEHGDEVLVATHGACTRAPRSTSTWLADLAASSSGTLVRPASGTEDLTAWLVAHSALGDREVSDRAG